MNLSSSGHRFSDVDLDDPEFRAHALCGVRRLWPLQDRQHPVRGGVRPPPQGARHPRNGRASRRHPDRARPPHDRRSPRHADQSRSTPTRRRAQPAFRWKTIPQGAATTVWAGFVAPADRCGRQVTARTATSPRSPRAPNCAAACAPTHSIPNTRRRCGRRARRWWASGLRRWPSSGFSLNLCFVWQRASAAPPPARRSCAPASQSRWPCKRPGVVDRA